MKKNISPSLLFGLLLASPAIGSAANIANIGVTVTETFDSLPSAADWSTVTPGVGGNSNGAVANPANLDIAVNSGLDSTDPDAPAFTSTLANQALASTTTYGTAQGARYNSAAGTVFTQPTLNYYTALMATVTNSTGSTLTSLTLTYDLVSIENATGTESQVPGHRVYFSATGAAGSWVNLAAFNNIDVTTNDLTTTINDLNWASGTSVYVLWADDNAGNIADDTLALDNVRWTAVPEPSVALLGGLGVLGLLRRRRA